MWTILVIADEHYDAIIEYFKKINVRVQVAREYATVITPLLQICIKRKLTMGIRGMKPDIIYCNKGEDEALYYEVLVPASICGMIKPLEEFTRRCYIK